MLLEMSPNGAEQCQGWSCNIAKCKMRNVAEQRLMLPLYCPPFSPFGVLAAQRRTYMINGQESLFNRRGSLHSNTVRRSSNRASKSLFC
ncbi:hypothetical protein PIB30_099215 [Stylosanthes scabra]|uniref:Uncharacterized protein n=1 Tax=Stylosanthes scabra TaxID=79078 RepID=A0ABU6YUJ5_9FABA|nr:hypothetical protein [Stylosanthes scabra]